MEAESKYEEAFRALRLPRHPEPKTIGPAPGLRRCYAILFTARSGSTWLTREIQRHDVLSTPDEYFNGDEFMNALFHNPAGTMTGYFHRIAEGCMTADGVFGFEINPFDLRELERHVDLCALMGPERYFSVLRRDDFVAQAVSMYLAEQSGFYHAEADSQAEAQRAQAEISYDAGAIAYWAQHILEQEFHLEQWLAQRDIMPLRFSYEDLCADHNRVVGCLAAQVGVPLQPGLNRPVAGTVKLATARNAAFARRFRDEQPAWCAYWARKRGHETCDEQPLAISAATSSAR